MTDTKSVFAAFIAEKKAKHGAISPEYSLEQQKIVKASNLSSGVVVACPGAGKTKVLLDRVAKLVAEGAKASEILLVTFTREAAHQFKERLNQKGMKNVPLCSTVHALAYKIISQKNKQAPEMVTEEQTQAILQKVRLVDPYLEKLSDEEILLEINKRREAHDATGWKEIVLEYENQLKAFNVNDFTSLLKEAILLLQKPHFRFVYVDEFQDLSDLQFDFIKKIAQEFLWFVGDPDQSIYSFKGSSERVLQELTSGKYPVYFLTNNYRGCQQIVDVANKVISQNIANRPDIKSARTDTGFVSEKYFDTANAEILAALAWQNNNPDSKVLVRTNTLKEAFLARGVDCFTVHEAKGLEWDRVWVAGCEESLFPHILTEVQEERRLFYVAVTRAKKELVLSSVGSRTASETKQATRAKSRFLKEAFSQVG